MIEGRQPAPGPEPDPVQAPDRERGDVPPEPAGPAPARGRPQAIARWLVSRAGSPFELLAELRHPVVRAEMRRTASRRRRALLFCVGLPLVVALLAPVLGESAAEPLGMFVCFWPLIMYMGAALAAAGAVMEEIEQETALQLVLTPIPARPLAAAKVLPRVMPYLWGIIAALPVYCLMGSSRALCFEKPVPSPLVLWPMRMLAPFTGGWEARAEPMGVLVVGPAMCLFDLLLVWTAASWGAVFAVRGRSLLRTAGRLAVQVAIQGALLGLCLLGGLVVGMLPISCAAAVFTREAGVLVAGGALGVLLGLGLFVFLLWRVLLCRATEEALTAFQAFDRLANEEFSLGAWPNRWVETAALRAPPERGPGGAGGSP